MIARQVEGSPQALAAAPAARFADAAISAIRGGEDARRLILTIREGCPPADALGEGLEQVRAAGDLARYAACCRHLQKVLIERRC